MVSPQPPHSVSGQVFYSDNTPLNSPGFTVRAWDYISRTEAVPLGSPVPVAANGTYRIPYTWQSTDGRNGPTLVVRVFNPQNTMVGQAIKQYANTQETLNITLNVPPPPPPTFTLGCTVQRQDTSAPLPNVRVDATFQSGSQVLLTRSSTTDTRGLALLIIERASLNTPPIDQPITVRFQVFQDTQSLPTSTTIPNLQLEDQKITIPVTVTDPVIEYLVQGTVRQSNGIALAGATVHIVDWDRAGEDPLVITRTNANGYYEGRFTADRFRSSASEVDGPDLIVRVYNDQGQLLATSPRRNNAQPEETIDLTVTVLEPAPQEEIFVVKGHIYQGNGLPLVGINVHACDRDLRNEQLLGQQTTDTTGYYEITYTPAQFRRAEKERADLVLRLFTPEGQPITVVDLTTEDGTPLENSGYTDSNGDPLRIWFNAPPVAVINGTVTDARYQGLSEHQQNINELTPLLDGASIRGLTDADIQFLFRETSIPYEQIEFLRLDAQWSSEYDVEPAVSYGLLRQGLSRNLRQLLAEKPSRWRTALQSALDANIIPAQLADLLDDSITRLSELAVELAFQADPEDNTSAPLGVKLATSPLPPAVQQQVVTFVLQYEGDNVWEALQEQTTLNANELDTVRFTLESDALLVGHVPTLQAVQQIKQSRSWQNTRDLAQLTRSDWQEITATTTANQLPEGSETSQAYAEAIADQVEQAFPTDIFRYRLAAENDPADNNVAAFLASNPDFDLLHTPINTFLNNGAQLGQVADVATLSTQLKTYSRIARLTPDRDRYVLTQGLLRQGYDSALKIATEGQETFISRMATIASPVVAAQLHESARARVDAANIHLLRMRDHIADLLPSLPSAQPTGELAEWTKLFGALNACQCKHCRSVYSPAAYLVDMLEFLKKTCIRKNSRGECTRNLQQVLFAFDPETRELMGRRPDLGYLKLNCDNSNIPLPHIDLVNELLELQVAPVPPAAAPDGWPYQTVGSTEEEKARLRATPAHEHAPAYERLATASYPWLLPFDLNHERSHLFAKHLNLNLWEIRQLFNRDEQEVARFYLGMSQSIWDLTIREEEEAFVEGVIIAHWGRSAVPTESIPVSDILKQANLTYKELTYLIDESYFLAGSNSTTRNFRIKVGEDPCNIDSHSINKEDSVSWLLLLDRLHRFLRLRQSLGWSINRLDTLLHARGQGEITSAALLDLVRVMQLAKRLRLSEIQVATLDDSKLAAVLRMPLAELQRYIRLFNQGELFPSVGEGSESRVDSRQLIQFLDTHDRLKQTSFDSAELLYVLKHEDLVPAVYTLTEPMLDPMLQALYSALRAVNPNYLEEALPPLEEALITLIQGFRSEFSEPSGPQEREIFNIAYNYAVEQFRNAISSNAINLVGSLPDSDVAVGWFASTLDSALVFAERDRRIGLFRAQYQELGDGFQTRSESIEQYRRTYAERLQQFSQHLDQIEQATVEYLASTLNISADIVSSFLAAQVSLDGTTPTPAILGVITDLTTGEASFDLPAIDDFISLVRKPGTETVVLPLSVNDLPKPLVDNLPEEERDRLEREYQNRRARAKQLLVRLAKAARLVQELRLSNRELSIGSQLPDPLGLLDFNRLPVLPTAPHLEHTEYSRVETWIRLKQLQSNMPKGDRDIFDMLALSHQTTVSLDDLLDSLNEQTGWNLDPRIGEVIDVATPLRAIASKLQDASTEIPSHIVRTLLSSGLLQLIDREEPKLGATIDLRLRGVVDLVRAETGWAIDSAISERIDVIRLLQSFLGNLDGRDFQQIQTYEKLYQAIQWMRHKRLSPLAFITIANANIENLGYTLEAVAEAQYLDNPLSWYKALTPINDQLRERKRDALVAYLLANPPRPELRSTNDLYSHFLIDVEMSACQMTSRIVQAHSAIQLFVQRCRMNLEQPEVSLGNDATASEHWKQWQWMKNYRVWEAGRKVFLYAENWIEPDLRDNKSPFFEDLENELLQDDLTKESVERAYRNYFQKLDQVAKLDVRSFYEEPIGDRKKVIHVIARTYSQPHIYFYRKRLHNRIWTAWEKIDLSIEGNHELLSVINGRLILFWLTFREYQAEQSVTRWEINLHWSQYENGQWQAQKSTGEKLLRPFLRQEDFRLQFDSSLDHKRILIYEQVRVRRRETLPADSYSVASSGFEIDPCKLDAVPISISPQYIHIHPDRTDGYASKFSEDQSPSDSFNINVGLISDQTVEGLDATLPNTVIQLVEQGGIGGVILALALAPGANEVIAQIRTIHQQTRQWSLLNITPNQFSIVIANQFPQYMFGQPLFYTVDNRSYFASIVVENTSSQGEVVAFNSPSTARNFNREASVFALLQSRDLLRQFTITFPKYRFETFYHPYICNLVKHLNQEGIEGILNASPSNFEVYRQLNFESPPKFDSYGPSDFLVWRDEKDLAFPYPYEQFDFSLDGAYSIYNWELFFHIPLLVADRLTKNQRFEEAQRWFHYIFDPTDVSSYPSPQQKFWQIKPFFEEAYKWDGPTETLEAMMQRLIAGAEDVQQQVEAWRNDPFNPHLIARLRPVAYMKTVVQKYLENLIAWGDHLFQQDTREAINEAAQIYVLAAEILGPRPVTISRDEGTPLTYTELAPALDSFSNALVDIETALPVRVSSRFAQPKAELPPNLVLYFCIPPNEKLLGYWDTISDRLFKIRNCMDIEGRVRQLPLFAPPIDPALLVRARAAGLDLSAVISGELDLRLPHYRYQVLIQKAMEFCSEVRSLGTALLSALEKKDAEELGLLRSRHEISMMELTVLVKQQQVNEAKETLESLRVAQTLAETRLEFYLSRSQEFTSTEEKAQLDKLNQANNAEIVAQSLRLAASIAYGVPDFANGGLLWVQWGGTNAGNALNAASTAVGIGASQLTFDASMNAHMANFRRRQDDWNLQADLAQKEIEQIKKQILSAEIRQIIAEQELANHEKQIDQAEEVEHFLKSKFTTSQLYSWMVAQLSALHYQTYRMAFDIAKKAEKCAQFELGLDSSTFNYIQFGHWDSQKKGLLAGERLHQDLRRMELAYLDKNKRELELIKHISLVSLNPLALIALKETGTCEIKLPEVLFDLDYPGHYMRRIKSISITIPCVTGSYTNVNCTLTLLSNQTRISSANPTSYPEDLEADGGDPRFFSDFASSQSIATSTAQNDSGLFEINFRDERYLPFEGAGVTSRWRIELAGKWRTEDGRMAEFPQFDFNTISDVILHLRYMARDGGKILKQAAIEHLQTGMNQLTQVGSQQGLFRLFSLRHEFPTEWHRFQQSASSVPLELMLSKERFPFLVQSKTILINSVSAYITNQEDPISVPVPDYDRNINGWNLNIPIPREPEENTIQDLFIICQFSITADRSR